MEASTEIDGVASGCTMANNCRGIYGASVLLRKLHGASGSPLHVISVDCSHTRGAPKQSGRHSRVHIRRLGLVSANPISEVMTDRVKDTLISTGFRTTAMRNSYTVQPSKAELGPSPL